MDFIYKISGENVSSLTEKQRMIWSLDALQKASLVREEYYRRHDDALSPLDGWNPQLHQNNKLMRLIVVDLIFTLIRSIEAFLGAVGTCWKISTNGKDISIKNLHRWMLRPGDKTLEEIKDILSQREIDNITLCKLCGFPAPESLEIKKSDQIVLWEVYNQTLKRMKTYGFFVYWYLNEFKEVRHAYSHNMRLLFLDIKQDFDSEEKEKAEVVGLLGPRKRGPNYLLLICESQRKSIGELAVRLCQLERILHENIKFYVLNDCTPVPPVSGVYIPERFQDDLRRIKESLGFEWEIPSIKIEMRDNKSIETQYQLHSDFLHKITKLGDRR